MQSLFHGSKQFEKIVLIDWYDGVVTALVAKQPGDTWLLASLLSYNISARERVYALLPVKDQIAASMLRELDAGEESDEDKGQRWDYLTRAIAEIADSAVGQVEIVRCKSLLEDFLTTWTADIADPEIRKRIGQQVEGAIQASKQNLHFGLPSSTG